MEEEGLEPEVEPVPNRRSMWIALIVLLVLIDLVLGLAFMWSILVFECHGGYECPI